MLPPQTVLALLLASAFLLLLLATLSTPVIKPVPLGSTDGVRYGVWGFCTSGATATCSPITVGYDVDKNGIAKHYSLPAAIRSNLTYVLIVHPIAAAIVLTCMILALFAHRGAASRSPRFLLGIFLAIATALLFTALAIITNVLLFVPHMAWGSWVVIAAGIVLVVSLLCSWFLRRAVIVRRYNQKRVEGNNKMNGVDYGLDKPLTRIEDDYSLPQSALIPDLKSPETHPDSLPQFTESNVSKNHSGITQSADTVSTKSHSPPNWHPGGPHGDGRYDANTGNPPYGATGSYLPDAGYIPKPYPLPNQRTQNYPPMPPVSSSPAPSSVPPQRAQRQPQYPGDRINRMASPSVAGRGGGFGMASPYHSHNQSRTPISSPPSSQQTLGPHGYTPYSPVGNNSAPQDLPGYANSGSFSSNPRESYYPSYGELRHGDAGRILSPIAASPPPGVLGEKAQRPDQVPGLAAPMSPSVASRPPGYPDYPSQSSFRTQGSGGPRPSNRMPTRSSGNMDSMGPGGRRPLRPSVSSSSLASGGQMGRSPTASETSHLLSGSQRGPGANRRSPMRRPVQEGSYSKHGSRFDEDAILSNNPEFSLPGNRANRGRGGGAHSRGSSRYGPSNKSGTAAGSVPSTMQPSPYPVPGPGFGLPTSPSGSQGGRDRTGPKSDSQNPNPAT